MSALIDFLKGSLRIGSVGVWLLAIAIALLLVSFRRTRPWIRVYLWAVFIGFWLIATPAVAGWLSSLTDGGYVPLQRADQAGGADTVVVLGAGSSTFHLGTIALNEPAMWTAFRIVEGARVYRLLKQPTVILMGGITSKYDPHASAESDAMAAAIVRLGVPADRIVLESNSKTTREQALAMQRLFAGKEAQPFVLVTSPTHMPRSMAAFRAVGLNPIPSTAPWWSDGQGGAGWLPSDIAILISDAVVYDTAARIYYWSRGWLGK